MRVAETRTVNFRNLQSQRIQWDPGLNLLTGPNGSGKTNCLEALHLLCGWGPFGGSHSRDLINWEAASAFLAARVLGEEDCLLEISLGARASLKADGSRSNWSSFRARIPALTFLPGDLALIEGSPAVRRRFLDVVSALIFPLYARRLADYRRIVRHRRFLLARGQDGTVALRATEDLACWIWSCRLEILRGLREGLDRWRALWPSKMALELRRGGSVGGEDLREDFRRSCASLAPRERAARTPLVGPHRDDLVLTSQGRSAAAVFSRGQRRRAALALVMAAASLAEVRLRRRPVLLLDEVAAELDGPGRRLLTDCLAKSRWQVFAASAEGAPDWPGSIWNLSEGQIGPFKINKIDNTDE